jgi:hypothetical protein
MPLEGAVFADFVGDGFFDLLPPLHAASNRMPARLAVVARVRAVRVVRAV